MITLGDYIKRAVPLLLLVAEGMKQPRSVVLLALRWEKTLHYHIIAI
jgi:hypothetical protein